MPIVRLLSTYLYLLPLAILGWLASCSDSPRDSADAVEAVLTSDRGLLRYVPEDTPYVFAALEPVPDEVLDKLAPYMQPLVRTYADMLKAGANRQPDDSDRKPLDDATTARLSAVIDELAGIITIEGISEAGIGRNSTAAFYGVGLLPVLRVLRLCLNPSWGHWRTGRARNWTSRPLTGTHIDTPETTKRES